MSKWKKRWLSGHLLGEIKLNLFTTPDGYDIYQCVNCDQEIKVTLFPHRGIIGGSCGVPIEQYQMCKDRLKKARLGVLLGKVVGCWSAKKAGPKCSKCETSMVDCPREGHPNSEFWAHDRNDGITLFICPKGCLEE